MLLSALKPLAQHIPYYHSEYEKVQMEVDVERLSSEGRHEARREEFQRRQSDYGQPTDLSMKNKIWIW